MKFQHFSFPSYILPWQINSTFNISFKPLPNARFCWFFNVSLICRFLCNFLFLPVFSYIFRFVCGKIVVNLRSLPQGNLLFYSSLYFTLDHFVKKDVVTICVHHHSYIRMPHNILQFLWVHSRSCHFGTECMSADMRCDLRKLQFVFLMIGEKLSL